MTFVAEYLKDAANYIDDNSRVIVAGLTDEQLEHLISMNYDLNFGREPGIDSKLVKTYETIEDFLNNRNSKWSVPGDISEYDEDEYPFVTVKFEDFQTAPGKQLKDMIVVDFGEYRVVMC